MAPGPSLWPELCFQNNCDFQHLLDSVRAVCSKFTSVLATPNCLHLPVCTYLLPLSSLQASEFAALGQKAPPTLLQPGGCSIRGFVGTGGPGSLSL